MDKWAQCGRCIIIAQVVFWVELPEQRRLCPNFVKLRTPGHLWILLVLSWCKWLLVCNDVLGGIWGVTHLAINFNTRFKDKTLKDLMCRAAKESKVKKFSTYMDTIGRINVDARNSLEHIPWKNGHSHMMEERYMRL